MEPVRLFPVRRFPVRLFSALAGLSFAATALGAGAAELNHAEEYAACMTLAGEDPEAAFEAALSWETLGGAEPARHCAAVALLGLGHHAEAARRLESLAEALGRSRPDLRTGALAQAGQAWLRAGNAERAHAVQSAALDLAPDNVELLIDRGLTLATAENYRAALDDLNQAANLAPDRPDILIFRASAQRFLGALPEALADVERALLLDPGDPDGLLERGNLRRLTGDAAGARGDWLRILDLAPDSPAGDAARANLAALDLKVE